MVRWFRALRQEAVEQLFVQTLRALKRLGDALDGILVEVQAGCAEGEIEIRDDDAGPQRFGQAPGHVVADGG